MSSESKRALIAMSGGVDSSVSALLTQHMGYECEGVTMRLYRSETIGRSSFRTCCSERDIDDAAEVAFRLDMPYRVLDMTKEFQRLVMDKFAGVYLCGQTPNPCLDCNRYMKFDLLLHYALEHGFDCIVTGHYARIERSGGRFLLKKALDPAKDQSYVLYMLTQNELSHTLFPLGELKKSETRRLAEENGFVNAKKHDSQDICFVPDGDYAAFIEGYTGIKAQPGSFVSPEGRILGRHRGCIRYTLGQRRGLGLPMGERVYVCGKDVEKNTVTVGSEEHLYTDTLTAGDVNWIAFPELCAPMRVSAKTRYNGREAAATVYPLPSGFRLEFDEGQRAVTPGQATVLYDGDTVLGGGTIVSAFNREDKHDIS